MRKTAQTAVKKAQKVESTLATTLNNYYLPVLQEYLGRGCPECGGPVEFDIHPQSHVTNERLVVVKCTALERMQAMVCYVDKPCRWMTSRQLYVGYDIRSTEERLRALVDDIGKEIDGWRTGRTAPTQASDRERPPRTCWS